VTSVHSNFLPFPINFYRTTAGIANFSPGDSGMNQLVEVIKVMAPPGIRWIHRAGLAIEVEET